MDGYTRFAAGCFMFAFFLLGIFVGCQGNTPTKPSTRITVSEVWLDPVTGVSEIIKIEQEIGAGDELEEQLWAVYRLRQRLREISEPRQRGPFGGEWGESLFPQGTYCPRPGEGPKADQVSSEA